MEEIVKLAILKGLEKEIKGFKPTPGQHSVDEVVTLKVSGVISKSEDVEYTPTADIPLLSTLAIFMEKSGFQREHVKALLIESMTEAINQGEKGNEHVSERIRLIEEAMAHVREVTSSLPKKIKTGPTRAEVKLEVA